PGDLLARRGVCAPIRTLAPDVIHAHFGDSGLAIPRTARPIVTTFNGDDLTGTRHASGRITTKSRFGIFASQYAAWRSKRCIAVSSTLRNLVWGTKARARTVVIRDAVDTSLFRPLSREVARERFGIPRHETIVIFPHNATEPRKRVWLAEAAVEVLRERTPNA